MGYMTMIAPCFVCRRMFGSNPDLVPSFQNEPICSSCIVVVNEERVKNGLDPWPIFDGAYEPQETA